MNMKKYLMTGIAALGMGSLFTSKFYRNTSSHSYRLLVSQPPLRHGVSVLQLLLAQEVRLDLILALIIPQPALVSMLMRINGLTLTMGLVAGSFPIL